MTNAKEVLISSQFELTNYIINSVRKQHMSQSERDVLLAIANYVNSSKDWTCFPSYETIADVAMVSVRTAKSAVASLKEKQVLTYKRGRSGVSNTYSISLESLSMLTGKVARFSVKIKPVKTTIHEDYDDLDAPF